MGCRTRETSPSRRNSSSPAPPSSPWMVGVGLASGAETMGGGQACRDRPGMGKPGVSPCELVVRPPSEAYRGGPTATDHTSLSVQRKSVNQMMHVTHHPLTEATSGACVPAQIQGQKQCRGQSHLPISQPWRVIQPGFSVLGGKTLSAH